MQHYIPLNFRSLIFAYVFFFFVALLNGGGGDDDDHEHDNAHQEDNDDDAEKTDYKSLAKEFFGMIGGGEVIFDRLVSHHTQMFSTLECFGLITSFFCLEVDDVEGG